MQMNRKQVLGGLVLVCLCSWAAAVPGSRGLKASARASSTAVSSSESSSTVKSIIAKAFVDATARGSDTFAIAQAAAEEVGYAYARAYAQVSGSVSVTGNGFASSTASASAWAQADIFARAIAGAVGEAVNGDTSSLSIANVEETKTAIAHAAVDVKIELTSTGGFAEATTTAVAEAVTKVIATALGDALAYNIGGTSATDVGSEANVRQEGSEDASVTTSSVAGGANSDATSSGSAEAIAQTYPWCSDAKDCCSGWRNGKWILGESGKTCLWSNRKGSWTYRRQYVGSIQTWREIGNRQNVCRC